MTHKKDPGKDNKDSNLELENRVYEMMELDRAKESGAIVPPQDVEILPLQKGAIDIFKALKTTPPVELITQTEDKNETITEVEKQTETSVEPVAVDCTNDFDDIVTEKVIKEITISESDALLAAEDTVSRNHLL